MKGKKNYARAIRYDGQEEVRTEAARKKLKKKNQFKIQRTFFCRAFCFCERVSVLWDGPRTRVFGNPGEICRETTCFVPAFGPNRKTTGKLLFIFVRMHISNVRRTYRVRSVYLPRPTPTTHILYYYHTGASTRAPQKVIRALFTR